MGGVVDAIFGGGPDVPDPAATAAAQGAANVDAARVTAALNRADQFTPFGSLTWSRGGDWDKAGYQQALDSYNQNLNQARMAAMQQQGNGITNAGGQVWVESGGDSGGYWDTPSGYNPYSGDSTFGLGPAPTQEAFGYNEDKWSSQVTLDPRLQALFDQNLAVQQGMAGATNAALGNVNQMFTTQMQSPQDYRQGGQAMAQGDLTDPQAEIDAYKALVGDASGLNQQQLARLQQLYGTEFNYNNAPAMPGADQATRQSVEDALFGRMTSRLDPQFQQFESDLEARLAAQGITQGSQAYDREQGNFQRGRTDAYQAAMNEAIMGGGQEMQRQFGMGLAARQQGVNEANTLRALPTQEALAASGLLGGYTQDLQGLYGTEIAQDQQRLNQLLTGQNLAQGAYAMDTQQRNQLLNELNALRTGMQVQMPQFGGTPSGSSVAPAPIADSINNAYNAQAGSYNSMMGGLAGLGGSLLQGAGAAGGFGALFAGL